MTPAGKATRRLSLLSGGEKALVALAFVFAVFLARPSPFYILDEVEAALDDANIDRFLQLVRRFSGRAQFVIVTHQKRTMDAADVLYGVSMGKGGITKVISRRLSHSERRGRGRGRLAPARNLRRDGEELARRIRAGGVGGPGGPGRSGGSRTRPGSGALQAAAREPLEEPPGAPGGARREPLRAARRRGLGADRGGTDPCRRRRPDHRRGSGATRDRGRGGDRGRRRGGSRAARRAARRGRRGTTPVSTSAPGRRW